MEKMVDLLNQDTIMIDLPARCVGQNINLLGTYIIILGEFQPSYLPEIQIWLVSGYSRLIESRKKMKVCNTIRRDNAARFSGNELR